MNLPDIKNYYYATLLDQMRYWFNNTEDKLWLNIEKQVTKRHNLYALAIAYAILPKINIPKLLSIRTTLIA